MISLLAAGVATGFLTDLIRSQLARPRPHVAAWTVAILMYAVATWALFVGLGLGWSDPVFRTYYLLGAILNVPVLALGSVYLNFGRRVGHAAAALVAVVGAYAAWVVLTAPLDLRALQAGGVRRGADVFLVEGPALLTRILSPLGALVIVVLSLVAVVRFWNRVRGLAVGNVLIVTAILVLSVGGMRVTLYEGAFLASTLLVGAGLLWAGYRVATGARR